MLFRLFVNICGSIWVFCIVLIAMSIALSSTLRIFYCPSSRSDIWVLLLGLYTPDSCCIALYLTLGIFGGWDK